MHSFLGFNFILQLSSVRTSIVRIAQKDVTYLVVYTYVCIG